MLAALLLAMVAGPSPAAEPSATGDRLYRMTLLRAAPGRLLDLVAEVQRTRPAGRVVFRHSQGDHWDLMVLTPAASYADHFRRLEATQPIAAAELVAWQEDEFVRGPDLGGRDDLASARLVHIEMFLAQPGRQADLIRERGMENAYLRALGRPTNAIFVRELGAAWDVFTVGAYRDWKHFAERDDIPPEKAAAAARAAGFEGDDRIGPYLRSLIQSHHDTLAGVVR